MLKLLGNIWEISIHESILLNRIVKKLISTKQGLGLAYKNSHTCYISVTFSNNTNSVNIVVIIPLLNVTNVFQIDILLFIVTNVFQVDIILYAVTEMFKVYILFLP